MYVVVSVLIKNSADQSGVSKSPGKSGDAGSMGAHATTILEDGVPGKEGSIQFHVLWNDGNISRYNSRYDIRIESWVLQDENDDGVFEPGEKVLVRDIVVRNYGSWSWIFCRRFILI